MKNIFQKYIFYRNLWFLIKFVKPLQIHSLLETCENIISMLSVLEEPNKSWIGHDRFKKTTIFDIRICGPYDIWQNIKERWINFINWIQQEASKNQNIHVTFCTKKSGLKKWRRWIFLNFSWPRIWDRKENKGKWMINFL